MSKTQQMQVRFWRGFRSYLTEQGCELKVQKPESKHWLEVGIGCPGIHLSAVALFWDSEVESRDKQEIRAELVIDCKASRKHFDHLMADKAETERELGESLYWDPPQGKQKCRIYLRRSASVSESDTWNECYGWLREKLVGLHRVFLKRVTVLGT